MTHLGEKTTFSELLVTRFFFSPSVVSSLCFFFVSFSCQSSDRRCSPSSRPSQRPPSLQLGRNLWTGTLSSTQSNLLLEDQPNETSKRLNKNLLRCQQRPVPSSWLKMCIFVNNFCLIECFEQ